MHEQFNRLMMTAERLLEYQWPPDTKNGEFYMLQEQISEYVGVTSFKRKYPELFRRALEIDERDYLLENRLVTEMQCDLGEEHSTILIRNQVYFNL